MNTTQTEQDGAGTVQPQFRTNSTDDLVELLERAANFHEDWRQQQIAAELRDAKAFVEEEYVDE